MALDLIPGPRSPERPRGLSSGSPRLEFLDGIARDGMDFKPPPLSAEVTVLVGRLESADSREQWSVVCELTRKRPPEAFAPLVAMLESDDAHARRDAALLLGVLDDRGAVPILIRCIAQWTGNDVTSGIAGLASIGKEGAIGHLEKALAMGDQELRMDSVAALVACRDARGVPALQAAAARDSDLQVREAARRAIGALGEQGQESIPQTLGAMRPRASVRWTPVALFLLLAFGIAWTLEIAAHLGLPQWILVIAAWGPGIAALLVRGPLLREGFRDSGLLRIGANPSAWWPYAVAFLILAWRSGAVQSGGVQLATRTRWQRQGWRRSV